VAMNSVVAGVVMGTAAVGLFSASVVGLLAISGRLNSEGVSSVPVLNKIVSDDSKAKKTSPADNKGVVRDATARRPQDRQSREDRVRRKQLFTLESFAPPTTVEEIRHFHAAAKKERELLSLERAALKKREFELILREKDLQERQRSVQTLMDKVTRAIDELESRRSRFEGDITTLKAAEAKNLKRQASQLAAMEPAKAADYLLELGPDKEPLAVKLLVVMDVEAASAILGTMDTKRGARLIEQATRVLQKE
jgi:hypothetical protein